MPSSSGSLRQPALCGASEEVIKSFRWREMLLRLAEQLRLNVFEAQSGSSD